MDLSAREIVFKDLMALCGTSHFYIDFYQREYKWNDKQLPHKPVRSLLNDIWQKFSEAYVPNSLDQCEKDVEKYPWYYLSSVLINTVDGKYYIVDGQQRLTTLTVAIIALLANAHLNSNIESNLKSLIVSGTSMSGVNQVRMQLEDRGPILRSLMEKPNDEELSKLSDAYENDISATNIIEAYKVCLDFFNKCIDSELILAYFCVYISYRLYLVKIEMEKSEDVAMAFEVINDRGTKLQSYEILKGKLLSLVPKDDNEEEIGNWDKFVVPLMTLYQKDRSDEFFESFFQALYSEEPEKDRKQLASHNYHQNVFVDPYDKRIGLEWTSDGKKRIATARELVNKKIPYYSEVFQDLYKVRARLKMEEESHDRFCWFNAKNGLMTNQTQLAMAVLRLNDTLKAEKIELVSKKLDKLYTLLKLTGTYNSSAFSPMCKKLCLLARQNSEKSIKEINAACDEFILDEIQGMKEDQAAPRKSSPFDYIAWNQITSEQLETSFVRYFFARIDSFIADKANQPNCDGYDKLLSGAFYHVEHILTHDKLGENAAKFETIEDFEFQRSLLGGVGILQGPVNCSSNDELYDEKLHTYVSSGSLWLRTLTADFYKSNPGFAKFMSEYDLKFEPYDAFGAPEIKKRGELLSKLTRIIWE